MFRSNRKLSLFILVGALLLVGNLVTWVRMAPPADAPVANPQFSRQPKAANLTAMKKTWSSPPVEPAQNSDEFAVDLRLANMQNVDLRASGDVLLNYATFDTDTTWPTQMPPGYDPQKILALGRNPGLGVEALHRQGLTGRGVHVAFIDQALLLDHEEYQGRIRKYQELGKVSDVAAMHGGAVVSILAGKTAGVAPDVTVTYYAVQVSADDGKNRTFNYYAQAVNAILDENARLPESEKVRVIGMSIGWAPSEEGYAEIEKAVARAKQEGVFILSTGVENDYAFKFNGLNRDPLADPDDYRSYGPGSWWQANYYQHPEINNGRVMVPMDSRTTAAPTGTSRYVFYRQGGWSWCIPYLEGLYALGLQVRPDLTPVEFYQAALKTGHYTVLLHDGKQYQFGPIIDPAGVIQELIGRI